MKNPLQRITLTFIIITLLPVAFMIYELGLLNKNERLVRETYQNQLDAILYSINQYSDDVISSWANRIRLELRSDVDSLADNAGRFQSILTQPDVVPYVYFSDLKEKTALYSLREHEMRSDKIKSTLDHVVGKNIERINKLIQYQKAGFRKMEAIDTVVYGNSIPILFVLDEGTGKYVIGGLIVNLPAFIENNLAPKMQAISQERFIISTFRIDNDSLVYSTESINNVNERKATVFKAPLQKEDFWLLPGYYFGITLKGASIDDLVKDRTTTSISILVLLILIFAAGILFLYRNVRREIHLSQAKSEFVSNVSHEIRTPLSLIGMFAETLEMGRVQTEEKKKEYYTIISKETARLSRLVNRILNFSQLDANKKSFTFGLIQLNDLSKEILESYSGHLKDQGFVVEFLPHDGLTPVRGDRESVSEAIINLLDNAIKYSRDKKHITVKTGVDRNYCFVEITDEGIGIEKNHQREIFDQFYRAPIGDVHTTKGSGLGLALVKKIMDAHTGEIKVESAPFKGSSFRLYFPTKTEVTS